MKPKLSSLWMFLLIASILLAACGGAEPTVSLPVTGAETDVKTMVETPTAVHTATAVIPEVAATELAETEAAANGGTVTVMGVWEDTELDHFLAMVAPFEEQTGIDVTFEEVRDVAGELTARLKAGSQPDIAALPNPGALSQFAAQGVLVPLDNVVDTTRLLDEYPAGLTNLAQVDGQTYGVFIKATVKNLIWYRPDVFQERGYQVPQTLEALQSLEQQIISEGGAPWCIGVDTGWPGTDWIEDMLLGTAGPETYDALLQHQVPWTDPAVARAWQAWGRIVSDPAMVYGGLSFVRSKNSTESIFAMFDEEPGCFLHHQGNFITTFVTDQFSDVQLGTELNFFPIPSMDEQQGHSLLVAGDMFAMFNDTPHARALMAYLTTAKAQGIWAAKGGYIAPNRAVSPDVYPDDVTRAVAQSYVEAESVRFDASDLLPQPVQDAFIEGIREFVRDPSSLQSILEEIESTAQETGVQ